MTNSLIWFRQDLRISDNPALTEAIKNSDSITALYILDEDSKNIRPHGAASKWYLHYTLRDLERSLKEKYNIDLIFRKGKSLDILNKILSENKITNIYWNRLYEPYHVDRDTIIKENLQSTSIEVKTFNASLLNEPWEIKNGSGNYFKVFTPYFKVAAKNHTPRPVLKAPNKADRKFHHRIKSDDLDSWKLRPTKPDWAKTFNDHWEISEEAAQHQFYEFLEKAVADYSDSRNIPSIKGTSKLSPYLHFGQISPNQILSVCNHYKHSHPKASEGIGKYISEIYWREFCYSLMFSFREMQTKNFRPEFDKFKWDTDYKALKAWQTGQTGYPIVDAGMRELWHTGWMHNRVRMITASFLTKHLLTDWRDGEEWFWDTLVDADLANNTCQWQWVAGSGADASPYFRIFNPVIQGEKFDSRGLYIRKWIPELLNLPNKYIHKPWQAPVDILRSANIILGNTYPKPIINHESARKRALETYKNLKSTIAADQI